MADLNTELDLKHRRLAVLHVWASGFDPNTDRIIEVGIKIHAKGKDPKTYHSLVCPGVPILPAATRIHGLTDADVASAPLMEEIAHRISRFLGASDLAGFDIRSFALPILMAEFRRCGVNYHSSGRSVIDIKDIYEKHQPRNLSSALEYYSGHLLPSNVDAMTVAEISSEVLGYQLERHDELPRSVIGLAAYPERRDPEGFFHIADGRQVFAEGRYRGRTPAEVAEVNPHYLRAMLGASLDWGVQFAIEKALGLLVASPKSREESPVQEDADRSPTSTPD